jgi:hypothetical protein
MTKANTTRPRLSPGDLDAWIALGRELGLEAVIITASMTSTETAGALVGLFGDRKAMWVRTRLCQIAEARTGARSRGRGRDKVRIVEL